MRLLLFLLIVFLVIFILFDLKAAIGWTLFFIFIILMFKVIVMFYPVFIVLFLYVVWKIKKYRDIGGFSFKYRNFDDFSNSNYEKFYRYSSDGDRSYRNDSFEDVAKYYKVLGIESNVSNLELKKGYKIAVRKYHPDAYPGISEEKKKELERKLQKVNEAYEKIKKIRSIR